MDPQLATAPSRRNQKVINLAKIMKDLKPAAENLSYQSDSAEVAENDVSRQKNPRKRESEPEFSPFPFL